MNKYKLIHSRIGLEKIICSYWRKKEGGDYHSKSLRSYYKDIYNIDAGMYTYGCFNPKFNFGGTSIEIGRYCSIASGVIRLGANHPLDKISMHPFFYNPLLGFKTKDVTRKKLIIGNGVWIGYNAIILPSCSYIGNGAVIGAGAVVAHDVEAYSVVAGNPARCLKMRFKDSDIQLIEKTKWWDYTPEELMEYYDVLDNCQLFFDLISNRQHNNMNM